mgnify:CR=1 FL=1
MIVKQTPFGEYYITRRTFWREWFLVKYHATAKTGLVSLGEIHLPSELIGKRVAFKIEVLDYEKAQEGRDILEDNSGDNSDSASGVNLNKVPRRRKKDSN